MGLFTSLIDNNPCLVPIQKMQYLHNYPQGEARATIGHITLSNDTYSLALKTLRRRYANPSRLCDEFAASLLDLPHMEHRSAEGLLRIITDTEWVPPTGLQHVIMEPHSHRLCHS